MIRLKELTKVYKDFDLNVTMEIKPGTVCGLIGKNGAGKSTTIKAILGLIRPTSGSIEVLGKDPAKFSAKDREAIGACLADSGFSRLLRLEDVVHILKKLYKDFDETQFRKLCKEQGLPADKKLGDYSTGMKAKLRVLTALCHKAKLLILDEPTAGLDVMARTDILDMLRAYMAEDEERSMLISSHISSDLEGLCDEIFMIGDGRLILHEDTDVLLDRYGILKLSREDYEKVDKSYLVSAKKQPYGYDCLTNEKQFYMENYPASAIENGNIDSIIMLMLGGEKIGPKEEEKR
ncbi:MAG: ABC transporter ATP-binding protein [Lachnospiraceae bacterium]|nr:ABC transporter ATP-binding protein [Lachnospiraceae bacterium]